MAQYTKNVHQNRAHICTADLYVRANSLLDFSYYLIVIFNGFFVSEAIIFNCQMCEGYPASKPILQEV